jgi:hypothetical protein
MKLNELRQIIREELSKVTMNEVNQPYKILSKKTEKSSFGDEVYDNYSLELKDEMYTTPDGLNFQLKTIGSAKIPTGKELDFDNEYHYLYYIQTFIYDENGKQQESIPSTKIYGYPSVNISRGDIARSINKAKKWLNQKGAQLMSGKGFQHKST